MEQLKDNKFKFKKASHIVDWYFENALIILDDSKYNFATKKAIRKVLIGVKIGLIENIELLEGSDENG